MVDFNALMLNPIYAALGVDAVLTLEDARTFTIRVIDKTGAVTAGDHVEVPTVAPVAACRYAELAALGMNADDIIRGTLAFNGFVWDIVNRKLDPNPSGERKGEVLIQLNEPVELPSSES